jgi:hypothetical protein
METLKNVFLANANSETVKMSENILFVEGSIELNDSFLSNYFYTQKTIFFNVFEIYKKIVEQKYTPIVLEGKDFNFKKPTENYLKVVEQRKQIQNETVATLKQLGYEYNINSFLQTPNCQIHISVDEKDYGNQECVVNKAVLQVNFYYPNDILFM